MENFRHIIRIANADLDGNKSIADALRKIKGVSFMFANAVCITAAIDRNKKAGSLSDAEAKKLDEIIRNPLSFGFPAWLLNRRKDYEDGKDKHLVTSELTFLVESDIRRQKKIKSYKGIRHMLNQPVRGQRTKSNFRVNKRKGPLGVLKSRTAKAAAAQSTSEKKK